MLRCWLDVLGEMAGGRGLQRKSEKDSPQALKPAKEATCPHKLWPAALQPESRNRQESNRPIPRAEVIGMGSSLKFMLLAEGKAQLYPRFAPTLEWDTAAAHGVLEFPWILPLRQTDNQNSLLYNKGEFI